MPLTSMRQRDWPRLQRACSSAAWVAPGLRGLASEGKLCSSTQAKVPGLGSKKQLLWPWLILTPPNAGRQEPPPRSAQPLKAEVHSPGGSACHQEGMGQEQPCPGEKIRKSFLEPCAACWAQHYFQMHRDNMKFKKGSSPKLTNIKKLTSYRGAGNSS